MPHAAPVDHRRECVQVRVQRAGGERARAVHAVARAARLHDGADDVDGGAAGRADDGAQHGAEQLVVRQQVRVEHLPRAAPVRDRQRPDPREGERNVEPAQCAARPRVGPRLVDDDGGGGGGGGRMVGDGRERVLRRVLCNSRPPCTLHPRLHLRLRLAAAPGGDGYI